MEDLSIPPSPEEEVEEQEELKEKPDFVRKIESFDVKNLTPENVEFMTETIQNYFLERFPVDPELVEQIPERIAVVSTDEFREAMGKDAEVINPNDMTGFYAEELNRIFINGPAHDDPAALFATLFHESLHFVSIKAGAGLTGAFATLRPENQDKENISLVETGTNTLIEGTTQLITLSVVLGNMGFNESETMLSYAPERALMYAIWYPFSTEERLDAYFNMSMEELRVHIEKAFEPEENREKIGPAYSNGIFADCLYNLGIATEKMAEAFTSWDTPEKPGAILGQVRRAVGYFAARDFEERGIELTDEDKEDLKDYFIKGEEDV